MSDIEQAPAQKNRLFPALLVPVTIIGLLAFMINGGLLQLSDGNWGEPVGRAVGSTLLPLAIVKIWASLSKRRWSALRMITTFSIIALILLAGLISVRLQEAKDQETRLKEHIARWAALKEPFVIGWPEGWREDDPDGDRSQGQYIRRAALVENGRYVATVRLGCIRPAVKTNRPLPSFAREILSLREKEATAAGEKLAIADPKAISIGSRAAQTYDIEVQGAAVAKRERLVAMYTTNCMLFSLTEAIPDAAQHAFPAIETALETIK